MRFRWLLLAGVLLLPPAESEAAPMMTDLATIRKDASAIVIGTIVPSQTDISIDVDKVIRGSVKTGKMTMKESPDGHSLTNPGTRVVAFIDANGAFRWVGELAAGKSIETGVLRLSGFFDFNAHIVSPSVMTLPQLEKYLAGGTLDQTFVATMSFLDGHGKLARSQRTFTVRTDHTKSLQVTGLGLPCLGNPSLSGLDWGTFRVSLSDTCPIGQHRWKRLDIEGAFTGVDANGAITVDATPVRPLVDERQMDRFGSEKGISDIKRVLKVTLADGSVWSWRVDAELVDPKGVVHAAGGSSSSARTQNGVTITEHGYDFGGPLVTVRPSGALVAMVQAGAITSCVFSRPGETDVTCTLSEDKPYIVR